MEIEDIHKDKVKGDNGWNFGQKSLFHFIEQIYSIRYKLQNSEVSDLYHCCKVILSGHM